MCLPKQQLMVYLLVCLYVSDTVMEQQQKPNIILILTDDQDSELFGMTPMQWTRRLIGAAGVTFPNAFVTTPICCVSRASILTGMYAHNHRTTNNTVPGGCASRRWRRHCEDKKTFAQILKVKSDYVTFYAGKYLNRYGAKGAGGPQHVPAGWDWWNGLVGNSRYYKYTLSVNGTAQRYPYAEQNQYLTTVIWSKAKEFLAEMKRRRPTDIRPFLMMLCPPAPHAPFTPEKRYQKRFTSVNAPRTPNYGVHASDKHWLVRTQKWPIKESEQSMIDDVFRNRWRTLLSVDDMIKQLIDVLHEDNLINNTFLLYTSDNGYHTGQFSLPIDKRQPYEFDIRVPFLLRGPQVPTGITITQPVLNIDIAPTILELAGVRRPAKIDGRSVVGLIRALTVRSMTSNISRRPTNHNRTSVTKRAWRQSFLIEYWGEHNARHPTECKLLRNKNKKQNTTTSWPPTCQDAANNTYTCVRHFSINGRRNSIYCQFRDAEQFVEYYNMKRDPYQLRNRSPRLRKRRRRVLNKLLTKLTACSGHTCT